MIFVGDIASPSKECSDVLFDMFKRENSLFGNNNLVLNLEGLLCDKDVNTATPVLFNHTSVIEPLRIAQTKMVTLANNHTLDLPESFQLTSDLLAKNKIAFCGAGMSKRAAEKPEHVVLEGVECSFFGFCWDVMMQHQTNPSKGLHVATIKEKSMLSAVASERKNKPQNKIILLLHWNLDLEIIPFPLHREFGRALIDAGADAVIGSHSHCVQGGEKYKNGVILYGLGNFFMPWYTYINKTIHFPDFTRISLALEWNIATNVFTCHWFKYTYENETHVLDRIASEKFEDSEMLKHYTPYNGLDSDKYYSYYIKNRRKGSLMPIYKSHKHVLMNMVYDVYLKNRIRFARFLAKRKLRSWNN